MSQPQVDVFEGSAIRKTKRRRTYVKSVPDSYEHPTDHSTKDALAQNTRKKKPGRPIKELKKKPIIPISQPKVIPTIQPPAIEESKPTTTPAKKSSRKNNKKRNLHGLKTITAYIRLLPIDYIKFTNNILVELSLVEFLQISFDFAKNLRSLSTRINNKSKKRKGMPVVLVVLLGSIIIHAIS
jgi:hypothetical protein